MTPQIVDTIDDEVIVNVIVNDGVAYALTWGQFDTMPWDVWNRVTW